MGRVREFFSPRKPDVWKLASFSSLIATIGALAAESVTTDTPHQLKIVTGMIGAIATAATWLKGDNLEYNPEPVSTSPEN